MAEHNYAELTSFIGFFIGDPMYGLPIDVYSSGLSCQVQPSPNSENATPCVEIPVSVETDSGESKASYVYAHTAFGDGWYAGNTGAGFAVDSGTIGVVPLELCKEELRDALHRNENKSGAMITGPGLLRFGVMNGVFYFILPNGTSMKIDTTRG